MDIFKDRVITFGQDIKRPDAVQAASLELIAGGIRTRLQDETGYVRSVYMGGDDEAYRQAKLSLPFVSFSGLFSERRGDGLQRHSGLVLLDFDKLTDTELDDLRGKAVGCPHTALVYRTPSGNGLRVVMAVTPLPSADTHLSAWQSAYDFASKLWGYESDPAVKDIVRASFLCHDPDVYANSGVVPLAYTPNNGWRDSTISVPTEGNELIQSMLDAIPLATQPNEEWISVGWALHDGEAKGQLVGGLALWDAWCRTDPQRYVQGEPEKRWSGFVSGKGKTIGYLRWLAEQNGWVVPQKQIPVDLQAMQNMINGDTHVAMYTLGDDTSDMGKHRIAYVALHHKPENLLVVWDDTKQAHVRTLNHENGVWVKSADVLGAHIGQGVEIWASKIERYKHTMEKKLYNRLASNARWANSANGMKQTREEMGTVAERLRDEGMIPDGLTTCDISELNKNGKYIGCANGILDLDTGELLSPQEGRKLFVTRSTKVAYIPDAVHPDTSAIFAHIDEEKRNWLLDAFGWSMRGIPSRRFYVLIGEAGTGKSTMMSAIKCAVGEYAVSIPQNALSQTDKNSAGRAQPHLLWSTESRIAFDSDLAPRTKIDNGIIKKISGGDEMNLRGLYGEHGDGDRATATVFLTANYNQTPQFDYLDDGLTSRLKMLDYPPRPTDWVGDALFRERVEKDTGAREALLALLMQHCIGKTEPPADIPDISVAQLFHKRAELGEEMYDWIIDNIEYTGVDSDRIPTKEAADEAMKADGNLWGKSRRAFAIAVSSLVAGGRANRMNFKSVGKTMNGWKGVRGSWQGEGVLMCGVCKTAPATRHDSTKNRHTCDNEDCIFA